MALFQSEQFGDITGDDTDSEPDVNRFRDDYQQEAASGTNVASLDERRGRPLRTDGSIQSRKRLAMPDTPSRPEIAAELRAAEARTELRIEQLARAVEARAAATDHKIDLLIGQVQALSTAIGETKDDNKATRKTIWEVGIGAVIAVLALVVALWIAGINIQGNMIAVFQAGLGVRGVYGNSAVTNPPASSPQVPGQSGTPAKN